MTIHHFHLTAEWPGGRNDIGIIQSGNLQTQISIPTEMEGPGIGTNPDEMLLGAASDLLYHYLCCHVRASPYKKGQLDHAIGSYSGCYEWCIHLQEDHSSPYTCISTGYN